MHKKPLVAVLIFGLLLLVHSVGFAGNKNVPYNFQDDAQLLPYIARGIVKDAPTTPTPLSGPTTNLQAGVSRTGATFCDGEWQSGGAVYYGNWYYGDEFYAAYQDPENLGTCNGMPDVYTFDVTGINWFIGPISTVLSFDFQPLVYENAGDAMCPLPGNVLCAGPLYTVTFPAAGFYILGLPFVDPCCSYTDYFAGVYAATFTGAGYLGIIIDDGSSLESCRSYNDYGTGWKDLIVDIGFAGNLELWSEGMTWDQNSCPGLPGVCDWVAWYGAITYYTGNPGANLFEERFTRYNPDVECTLMSSAFMFYAGGSSGTPTAWFRVYGNNGPVYGGTMYPGQDANEPYLADDPNLIFKMDVPWASLTTYPAWQIIDWSVEDPNWPTGYVYGTGENLFVGYGLSPNTPNPTDILATMIDAGTGAGHSGGYLGVAPGYYYYADWMTDYGNAAESYFCCEIVELAETNCANPGPDDWNTWGHDYGRTCATSIEVGDPCEIKAAWTGAMPGALAGFCEPTIADNKVFSSVDNKLYTFDLTSGAPGYTISGLPHIYASNRGNMTIEGGKLYVTGGSSQSIGQWNAAAGTNNWVNGIGYGTGSLGGNCRYGVTAVYDIGSTEVVVVGTEGATGRLWCFETATGALYAGWTQNPRILPDGIWHSPAYDGTDLYVGTANTSNVDGNIFRINAATGAIVWTFTPANPLEGFPGGVSVDGDYVYSASSAATLAGSRAKIDKATGAAVWSFAQERGLYGVPAIGRNFLYINQDNAGGVLVIEKNTGAALYNFAANGVGAVPEHVTITCDNYLFAGDRLGNWWCLNVNDQVPEFAIAFNGIVNGTAIANDGTDDFAVVSVRGTVAGVGGKVAAFKFNAGPRPRVQQNVYAVDIPVPFGTGVVPGYTVTGALENVGCADLNIVSINQYDPPPDAVAKSIRNEQSRYAAAAANVIVGADYTAYFDNSTKKARLASAKCEFVSDELTRGDVARENASKALADSKRSSRMAAAAPAWRTVPGTITYTSPLAANTATDVVWNYDGTDLLRGVDYEEIEFITDDPDRIFFNTQPILGITYVGGCLDANTLFTWNTDGAANEELVYNYGALADDDTNDDLHWGADPEDGAQMYEATFLLAGPEPVGTLGESQFYMSNMYENWDHGAFLGNPITGTSDCGFTEASDVHMGYKRTNGCPGDPVEILGGWVKSYYVDSNMYFGGTVYEAIGLDITLTEVGAYDPEYGDFAFLKWDMTERDGDVEDPVYAGTWADWDVQPDGNGNHGIVSHNFNGYALWDWQTPTFAYGFFDPRMSTDYCGLNTAEYSPKRIQEMGQRSLGGSGSDGFGCYGLWQGLAADEGFEGWSYLWDDVVSGAALESGPHQQPSTPVNWDEDHAGLLVNKAVSFAGHDTKTVIQAKYGLDMSDVGAAAATDVAAADAKVTALARRAAIWGGWARGDVNMDGCVNLLDVCWVTSGNQIYPDNYNGDVNLSGGNPNAADATYLLQYVTGLGPAPLGAWRFAF